MKQIAKKTPLLLVGVIVFNLLITISPFVDYYSNWQITAIPLMIIMLYNWRNRRTFIASFYILAMGFALVMYQFWFIHRVAEPYSFMINGIIAWTPCIIAIACTYSLKPNTQKIILQIALIAMMITSYTTIIGLETFPFAARELAGAADQHLRDTYMLMNIGGFEFIYALVLAIPIVMWMIENTRGIQKVLNIVVLISFLYCIYMSSYATALIIAFSVLWLMVLSMNPEAKPLLILFGVLFIVMICTGLLAELVLWMRSFVESDYVADRLLQVAQLLQGTSANDVDTDTTNERLVLMQNAWDGFVQSPLWGNNIVSWNKSVLSGHSFVLDILSASGVLGLLIYCSIFFSIFKRVFQGYFKHYPFQCKTVWLAFIALTIMNPSAFAIIYIVIFLFTIIINNIEKSKNEY